MTPALRCVGLWSILGLCLACPCARLEGQDSSAAGGIAGLVIDTWHRQPLPGVIVTVRGTTLATTTDAGGQYRLDNIPAGEHIVVFSKSGFARSVVSELRVAPGQVTRVDNHLRPEFYEMEEYVVTAAQLGQQMADLLEGRKESINIKDSIGSEFFGRAGAGDAAEIMTKVTGVTVVDSKYVFVRGLGERYGITLLNGAEVPSADPDKKAVQLDIFPSDSIERIETSKTFTPDMPGSFSGGAVNIVTRKFPEKFFFDVSIGFGWNSLATYNEDFLTYNGGSTDWAGFDDGTREVPGEWSELSQGRAEQLVSETRSGGGRTTASRTAAANELLELGQAFDDQMAPHTDAPPPDLSFSAALGNRFELFGRPFGFLVGVNYDRKFRFYDDGFFGRYQAVGNLTLKPLKEQTEMRGVEEVSWGSIVNLAYQLHENHEIAFNFLYNRNSEDEALIRSGFNDDRPDDRFDRRVLHYTERELQSYQLLGTHRFPDALDMKTDWTAAFSTTSQNEPDYRIFEFIVDPSGRPDLPLSALLEPTRYFREISENNLNLKLDQTVPFQQWTGDEGKVKLGVYQSATRRDYMDRRFAYSSTSQPRFQHFVQTGDPSVLAEDEFLTFQPTVFGAYQFNAYVFERPFTEYEGTLDVNAAYAMAELPLFSKLTLIGGARYEISELAIEAAGIDARNVSISEKNLLPAAGLVYEVTTDMNLRLGYGKTLARPTFREIGPPYFDFVNEEIIVGNPDLQQTLIDNFDARWEWFRRPGEVLAVSAFYKTLEAPIEKTIITRNGQVRYENRKEAIIYGLEFEARTQLDLIDPLFEHFNVGANFSWIESETDASDFEYDKAIRGIEERPLQGQSPYVINADITYSHPKLGTTASLFYNIFGERISEVSAISPNIFEQPVHTIDFTFSQRLTDHITLKFAAKNLLDPVYKKTIEFEGEEFIYRSFRRGRTFTLALNFEW